MPLVTRGVACALWLIAKDYRPTEAIGASRTEFVVPDVPDTTVTACWNRFSTRRISSAS
jgi:hypothetical protein